MIRADAVSVTHTHIPQRSYLQKERTGDLRGNCSTRFPFYISFQWKSFYPHIALPGNPRRKSLTCLHMESNCPKTGPDPNKRGAKLSQMGLDSKTETRAIWITTKSPCNDQRWGNHVWLALFVFFDCWTNLSKGSQSPLLIQQAGHILFLTKIVHWITAKERWVGVGGGVVAGTAFDVLAELLLHGKKGKATQEGLDPL